MGCVTPATLHLLLAALALFLSAMLVLEIFLFGRPNAVRCGAPTRRRGWRCRNPARPGRPCGAGHTRSWIGGNVFLAAVLAAAGIALPIWQPLRLLFTG